jgi:hypothetical protein
VILMIEIILYDMFFILGSRPISWACKKHRVFSLSLAKVEYRVVVIEIQEALWI